MRVATRVGVTVALVAAAAAGCTTQDPGTATPGSNPPPTTPSVSIPPRPKNLSATVDPCSLLTSEQMAALKIRKSAPGPASSERGSTASCSYLVSDPVNYSMNLSLDLKRGIEYWLTYTGTWVARQTTVSSFPAVQIISKGENWDTLKGHFCYTIVGIADGQEMFAGIAPSSFDLSNTQMCDLTKQLAAQGLATLQTKS